jgi:hypothetical protein
LHGLDQCWAVVSTSVGPFSLFFKEFSVSVFGAGFTNHHSFQNFRKNSIRWFSALVVLRDGFHKSFSQIMVFSFIYVRTWADFTGRLSLGVRTSIRLSYVVLTGVAPVFIQSVRTAQHWFQPLVSVFLLFQNQRTVRF